MKYTSKMKKNRTKHVVFSKDMRENRLIIRKNESLPPQIIINGIQISVLVQMILRSVALYINVSY